MFDLHSRGTIIEQFLCFLFIICCVIGVSRKAKYEAFHFSVTIEISKAIVFLMEFLSNYFYYL